MAEAPPALAPTRTPPAKRELAPEEELEQLEQRVLRRGMSREQLATYRAYGDCPEQIQDRIDDLHRWLSAH